MMSVPCVKMEESWSAVMVALRLFILLAWILHSPPYQGLSHLASLLFFVFFLFSFFSFSYNALVGNFLGQQQINQDWLISYPLVVLGSVAGVMTTRWKEKNLKK